MFAGRYGNDQLNQALGLVAICVSLPTMFLRGGVVRLILTGISTVCIVIILFRMLSRNVQARQAENAKFFAFMGKLGRKPGAKNAGSQTKTRITFAERRKYKYFICSQCAQKLRVPRGKGKLRVTCTRCGNKFEIKS